MPLDLRAQWKICTACCSRHRTKTPARLSLQGVNCTKVQGNSSGGDMKRSVTRTIRNKLRAVSDSSSSYFSPPIPFQITRHFFGTTMKFIAAALLAVSLAGPGVTFAQQSKPNIVLVLMDNFGWGELGVYGGGILRGAPTPRIDKLAAEGMRLLNFNVEAQCTPSRAALMTGRYAVRTGNGTVPISTPMYGLTQWEVTMAEMLSDAGYATGMFGKWHLGHTDGRFPTDQGFDEWYRHSQFLG